MAKFASKLHWGQQGVDWDERINFASMREEWYCASEDFKGLI